MNAMLLLRALMKRGRSTSAAADSFGTAYRLDAMDARHIARYNASLGFATGELPLTYYYLIAQRAHLATLLGERFPFPVAGMVHVENELIEYARPALADALEIVTTVQVEPPTDTGARYCRLESVAQHAGQPVFTCRSRYLARRGQRKPPASRGDEEALLPLAGAWKIASGTGREYAAVSGDWNPIHLWKWSARLMGLKEPIIHGMHTLAKACAAIQSETGSRITSVGARFKAPIPLGEYAGVALSADRREFQVVCHGRVAVEGTLGFVSTDPVQSKE